MRTSLLFVAIAIVMSASTPARAASAQYTVDPVLPGWVRPQPLPQDDGAAAAHRRPDVLRLLWETQDRVTAAGAPEHFYRIAYQVTSIAGVQNESEIEITFAPAFEKLLLHSVRVHRDGQTRDAIDRKSLRVIDAEEALERRILNGRVKLLAFLEDIRVGDVIEYAYSIVGDNPALAGHYDETVALAADEPVLLRYHRVLSAKARAALHVKEHGGAPRAAERDLGDDRELAWELRARVTVPEEGTPQWYSDFPWVQLTDFTSWHEVAAWAAKLFAVDAPPPPEVHALVEQARSRDKKGEALAVALLQFVQDDVRYLGMELGEGSLAPSAPAVVLQRRFGDCKDKAVLLRALLTDAGFDAQPALVSTQWRQTLDELLPSASVFDHAIVRLRLGEATLWLDGTADHERGPLRQRPSLPFRRALAVAAETESLSELPLPALSSPTVDITESYTIAGNASPGNVRVVTQYRGEAANHMRYLLATTPVADVQEHLLERRIARDAAAEATAPPEIKDDVAANMIQISEQYLLSRFWDNATHDFFPWAVHDRLDDFDVGPSAVRQTPLEVPFPAHIRHQIIVHLPEYYRIESREETVRTDAFVLHASVAYRDDTLTLTYSLQTLADEVPAAQFQEHVTAVERARDAAGLGISNSWAAREAGETPWGAIIALAVLVIGSLAAIPLWRRLTDWFGRRRARRFRMLGVFAPGEAPETAVLVDGEADVLRFLAKARCGCGRRLAGRPVSGTEMRFGDVSVVAYQVPCASCGAETPLYFRYRASSLEQRAS